MYRPLTTVRLLALVGIAIWAFFATPELRAQDSCGTEKGRPFPTGSRDLVIEKSVSFLIRTEK